MGDAAGWQRLTADEAAQFERDGYLVFEDVLSTTELDRLRALAETLERRHYGPAEPAAVRRRWWPRRSRPAGHELARPVPLGRNVEFHDVLLDRRVLDLIDHPATLPKVAGVLGWNISVYLTTLVISPPAPATGDVAEHVAGGWHQDSSRVNEDLRDAPRPRLSAKLAFFLSDVSAQDAGNMWIVPGSHLSNDLPDDADRRGVPLRVRAGTVVLFDRRLWHSASPNHGGHSRHVVFIGYAHRWLHPHDDLNVGPLLATASPLRRQLLGWAPDATSRYAPDDEDVPLRALCEPPVAALTETHLDALRDDGYVRLPDAVPERVLAGLREAYATAWEAEEETNTERLHLLRYAAFRRLIDHPAVLAGPRGVLGEHLQLLDVWLNFQPGAEAHPAGRPDAAGERDWHRDLTFLGNDPARPLMLNMLLFLDDVDEACGPTRVLPGSHRARTAPVTQHSTEPHPDEVAVPMRAGDLLLFNSSLVHSRGRNRSGRPRRGIALLWGYWFVKPVESTLPLTPGARVDADETRLRIVGLRQPTVDQYLFEPF